MSWITGLAGKAEDFLNKIDQTAAGALNQSKDGTDGDPSFTEINELQQKTSQSTSNLGLSSKTPNHMQTSASVPSNLSKMNSSSDQAYLSQMSKSAYVPGTGPAARSSPTKGTAPASGNKKDKDDELFEFLNSPDTLDNGTSVAGKKKERPVITNGKHSRQSSTSSVSSHRSNKTPDPHTGEGRGTPVAQQGIEDSIGDNSVIETSSDEVLGATESTSGYQSQDDNSNSAHQQQLSSLELENRLLKNEVTSLNQEMTTFMQRAKSAQEELHKMKQKLEAQRQQVATAEQVSRECQARDGDHQEALKAKDAQLAVLRVRWEEADQALRDKEGLITTLKSENARILDDHTSVSGVQSQAMDSLKDKLADSEQLVRREQEAYQRSQQEATQRQSKLEAECQSLAESLTAAQRKLNDEKLRLTEITSQMKSAKGQAETARQELTEYKEKATRILQSKDKLISSLKEGTLKGDGMEQSFSSAELEEMRQERDLLRQEVQQSRMTMDTLRTEIQDLEIQMQTDSDQAADQIRSLEENLAQEKRSREDGDQEITRQKQELRYAHEELLKQKTQWQSRVQDRENEIERLRNQLTAKSLSTNSQAELENRLHSLTESLIQKQTVLEALSTEKNSLVLQLERMESQYKDLQACTARSTSTAVSMNDDDDVRQRLPLFMKESPMDGDVAKRVKRAADSIDKFSIRLGVFLRRYPMARIFVIIYMALLHLWTFIILSTYKPEVHLEAHLDKSFK